mmetsp:Transcript_14202/g.23518  ORF Transcript_14202/g.23518 Transcript_14202/m.23518 type:complete len:136 (-) Transcript_14202:501-908(-)
MSSTGGDLEISEKGNARKTLTNTTDLTNTNKMVVQSQKKFKLSPEDRIEYERIYDLFAGDEKNISAKQLGIVMSKLGVHTSVEELDDMIDVVDKDGYGLIHKKHFMQLMTQKVKETSQDDDDQSYESAFKMYDSI